MLICAGGGSVTGQLSASHSHMDSQSVTQVYTTVSGAKNVTIDNGVGRTTLDGARVSGGSVDVTAGNLNITSAQNTASYLSTNESAGFSFAVPVYGTGGEKGFSVNASAGILYDTYASTEASGLSGLYAGQDGLDVDVAHNTTLSAGVMESTAASGHMVTTGSLTAYDEQNISICAGASINRSLGSLGSGGNTGPGNGAPRRKRKSFYPDLNPDVTFAPVFGINISKSFSSIGSNINIDAGSLSGSLSRNPSAANHAISNEFDANQAGEILSLTNSFEKSYRNAYGEAKDIQEMTKNASLTDQEREENDAK
ncbi:hypothetical protein B0W47_15455 [Komagataeibacter nataicola]|uniref:Uncharacterized protein n=1 Tax=Komagataeibacter nataicola TaxID=265960 RepID=A0A9N7CWI9_9PROT|nr:hemagglutinin repeat-containing protein [Komagataeibacter nataicola]AQU88615.1 hypothetical protein B0W47_15455 [Komagataeibacter nataicola]PYD64854.1 hypothetical protein CDI09_16905 [Komagataeibacter nataicola]WEQ57135.1 hemagglutinin repeat-containing protein [Komagataeibacter nataicola]